ncbi:MAG: phosphate starvation-inducible protein PhoH [Flavobacteriales bacterium TMED113]|nr:MAG: phosphate starvation-inducible protein PhoH [Flavobacteriales bacterium TMED113]
MKKKITLNDIDLVDFFGVQNKNLKFIKSFFADLDITARGETIIASGSKKKLDLFTKKIQDIIELHKSKKLTYELLQSTLIGEIRDKQISDTVILRSNSIIIKPKSPKQKMMVDLSEKNDLLFVSGPAGTGKTYVAVCLAVKALKNNEVKRIILTRPAVESGESLGFLPGDLNEKIDPYMAPLYDALTDLLSPTKLKYYFKNKIIEIVPLAFMRGRTLDEAFVILDEAQNATILQMKMFLTRMGSSAKFIITGDETQVDLPKNKKSGFIHAVNILKNVKKIGFLKLEDKDVIRHHIVKLIIKAYKENE